ncbi:prophage tail fiber N-terminal domain-containing protein [Salmonella enterica]|nr:phage tail protein [Salmonella enterica]EBU1653758.1 phage tail protein [Salmonella enterica]EGC9900367.1 phage tail protein [Salmonella enterica]ELM1157169.1 prophage tail fiber N-terminal domain-containing protein [Salmonella enterica]ELN0219462.1 prophage tail fiber N-terminal domain-containing protein [Salmonella enterica]
MAVKISGVLKDGTGKPVQNCTIQLKAKRNSTTVVVNTLASENPDEAGRYSMDVEYGQYSVILLVEGFPPSHAGTITVYEDSRPGTLNDFLGAMTEDDARPEALRRFELMVEEVARNASVVAQNTAAAKKSASDASTSAREAATHATDAAGSASAASTSAGQAASSAQSATSSAGTASTKATEASKSAAAAESSKSAAATSASAAKTSETNAAASQQSAATSASTATTKASEAATSARDAAASKEAAKSSETNASSSASSAASSATAAGNSAKAAKTSETNARSSETAAGQSASAAAGSKTAAASSASAASTSAGQASASATAAGKSAESAASSASTATTKAGEATEQATAAARSASAAKTSETNAKTSADNAASSKAAAASSAGSAASSASSASASKDEATRQASAAKGSATTATTKASEAAGSATAASQSKVAAESAATRAETAAKRAEDIADAVSLEDASTTKKGVVQLSSATNSTSETQAATPKAVKAAYDLANGKYTAQDATTARKGLVQLSSATNSMSETLAATPKAVKTVMDETNKKAPLNSPALTGTPTTPTARQGTNNTQIANTAFVMAAIAALVDSSPDALNTLNELAAALGNDPNFATTMTNALAGKQPKDATLTALAGLATAADRFPYFTGNDTASLATLTKVGRDILAQATVSAVIEYLGLQETVNRARNAVQKNGDTLSGGLTFENDSILAWIRNTDWAKIGFKNDADSDTDSYMWFETGDNGNEYFKWRSRQSTTTKDLMNLKWDALYVLVKALFSSEVKISTVNALRIFNSSFGAIFRRSEENLYIIPTRENEGENGDIGPLRPFDINLRTGVVSVGNGARIDGGLALGTNNALGGNSIVLGDNDTGFRQDGDGIISFYSNGSRIGHIDELGLHIYKDIESNGSSFRLKGNYRHHITFANEDGSIRMFLWKDKDGDGVHINNGSSGGGDFVFKTDGGFALGSGAQVASNGDIYGSVWENNWLSTWLHNHVVRDIRLGSIEYKNVWRDSGFGDASGYVLTAAINSNADDIVDTVARRPIQKLIGGIWYNVGSV